jgi:hypothetical protein
MTEVRAMKTEQFSLRRMLIALSLIACGLGFFQSVGSRHDLIGVPGILAMLAGAFFGAGIGTILKRPVLGAALGTGAMAWLNSVIKAFMDQ